MQPKVVVLGAGYAGASAVRELENELPDADLTWVSDTDYHLVLHEAHRVIRDPSVKDKITIPISEIKSPSTSFVEGEVVDVDTDERVVELDGGDTVDYDYLLIGLGSSTAYYGIPGMEEHALTLKSLDDALSIHDAVAEAARDATRQDPAQVVVGGAGLSGIQSAGEIAEFRDYHSAPIDIYLVEALEEIFPPGTPELQATLRDHLEAKDVEILTDDPITEAEDDRIHFDERDTLEYDVFLWAGGIAGREALEGAEIEKEHNRVNTGMDFQTSDDRVFAVGDSAIVDQPGERPAPPTAQAAWDAASVAGANLARSIRGERLQEWVHEDKGTLISIGSKAVAHDVNLPLSIPVPRTTFGSYPAEFLKKAAAARWIADIAGWNRALDAWDAL